MLILHYDSERARIDDNGSVDYAVFVDDAPIITEAPTETIQRMVLAVMPLVMSDVTRADLRVTQIKAKMEVVTNKVVDADNAKYLAASDAQTARSSRAALSVKLRAAEGALQLARVSAVS